MSRTRYKLRNNVLLKLHHEETTISNNDEDQEDDKKDPLIDMMDSPNKMTDHIEHFTDCRIPWINKVSFNNVLFKCTTHLEKIVQIPVDYYIQTYARLLLRQLHYNSSSFQIDWNDQVSSPSTSSLAAKTSIVDLVNTLKSCYESSLSFATLLVGPPDAEKISVARSAVNLINSNIAKDSAMPIPTTISQSKQHFKKRRKNAVMKKTEVSSITIRKFYTVVIPSFHRDETPSLSAIGRQLFELLKAIFLDVSKNKEKQLLNQFSENGSEKSLKSPILNELLDTVVKDANIEWAIQCPVKGRKTNRKSPDPDQFSQCEEQQGVLRLKRLSFQQNVKFIKVVLKHMKEQNAIPIIVLENMESLVLETQRQTVLYNLLNLLDSKSVCFGVIGTSSIPNISARLEKRVKSRFGLNRIFTDRALQLEQLKLLLMKHILLTQPICNFIRERGFSVKLQDGDVIRWTPSIDMKRRHGREEESLQECINKSNETKRQMIDDPNTTMFLTILSFTSSQSFSIAMQSHLESYLKEVHPSYPMYSADSVMAADELSTVNDRELLPDSCDDDCMVAGSQSIKRKQLDGGKARRTGASKSFLKHSRREIQDEERYHKRQRVEEGPMTNSSIDISNSSALPSLKSSKLVDQKILDWQGFYHDEVLPQLSLPEMTVLVALRQLYKMNSIPKTYQLILRQIKKIHKDSDLLSTSNRLSQEKYESEFISDYSSLFSQSYRIAFLRLLEFGLVEKSTYGPKLSNNNLSVKYPCHERLVGLKHVLQLPTHIERAL